MFDGVSLEGLEWNTIENMVIKWNQVFKDFIDNPNVVNNSYI